MLSIHCSAVDSSNNHNKTEPNSITLLAYVGGRDIDFSRACLQSICVITTASSSEAQQQREEAASGGFHTALPPMYRRNISDGSAPFASGSFVPLSRNFSDNNAGVNSSSGSSTLPPPIHQGNRTALPAAAVPMMRSVSDSDTTENSYSVSKNELVLIALGGGSGGSEQLLTVHIPDTVEGRRLTSTSSTDSKRDSTAASTAVLSFCIPSTLFDAQQVSKISGLLVLTSGDKTREEKKKGEEEEEEEEGGGGEQRRYKGSFECYIAPPAGRNGRSNDINSSHSSHTAHPHPLLLMSVTATEKTSAQDMYKQLIAAAYSTLRTGTVYSDAWNGRRGLSIDFLAQVSKLNNSVMLFVCNSFPKVLRDGLTLSKSLRALLSCVDNTTIYADFPLLLLVAECLQAFPDEESASALRKDRALMRDLIQSLLPLSSRIWLQSVPGFDGSTTAGGRGGGGGGGKGGAGFITSVSVSVTPPAPTLLDIIRAFPITLMALKFLLQADTRISSKCGPSYLTTGAIIPLLCSAKAMKIQQKIVGNDVRCDWGGLWSKIQVSKLQLRTFSNVSLKSEEGFTETLIPKFRDIDRAQNSIGAQLTALDEQVRLFINEAVARGYMTVSSAAATTAAAADGTSVEQAALLGSSFATISSSLTAAQIAFGAYAGSIAKLLFAFNRHCDLTAEIREIFEKSHSGTFPGLWHAGEIRQFFAKRSFAVAAAAANDGDNDDNYTDFCVDAPLSMYRQGQLEPTSLNRPTTLVRFGSLLLVCETGSDALVQLEREGDGLVKSTVGRPPAASTILDAGLSKPKDMCIYHSAAGPLLIVADTNRHCIKVLALPNSDVVSENMQNIAIERAAYHVLAGGTGVGYEDHITGKNAKFKFPTAVMPMGSCIVVCDMGNNCLRIIDMSPGSHKNPKQRPVQTLIGQAGIAGSTDGNETRALLNSPSAGFVVSSGKKHTIYFVETATSFGEAAVRAYCSTAKTVTTLHRGMPLQSPKKVCAYDENHLLVTDSVAGAVFKICIEDKTIEPFLTSEHVMKLRGPRRDNATSTNSTMVAAVAPGRLFQPCGIIKIDDGNFYITDIATGIIHRYIDRRGCCEVERAFSSLYRRGQEARDMLNDRVSDHFALGLEALRAQEEAVEHLMRCKLDCSERSFGQQVANILEFASQNYVCKETFVCMIHNAPSFTALCHFLHAPDYARKGLRDAATKEACASALVQYIGSYNFAIPYVRQDVEIRALTDILRANVLSVNTQECLCVVLKNEDFKMPIGLDTLKLIGSVLDRGNVQWTLDRGTVADLRREVLRYLNRVCGPQLLTNWGAYTHQAIVSSTLQFWVNSVLQREDIVLPYKSNSSINNNNNTSNSNEAGLYARKVALWMARVHLDSVCGGIVTVLPGTPNDERIHADTSTGTSTSIDSAKSAGVSYSNHSSAVASSGNKEQWAKKVEHAGNASPSSGTSSRTDAYSASNKALLSDYKFSRTVATIKLFPVLSCLCESPCPSSTAVAASSLHCSPMLAPLLVDRGLLTVFTEAVCDTLQSAPVDDVMSALLATAADITQAIGVDEVAPVVTTTTTTTTALPNTAKALDIGSCISFSEHKNSDNTHSDIAVPSGNSTSTIGNSDRLIENNSAELELYTFMFQETLRHLVEHHRVLMRQRIMQANRYKTEEQIDQWDEMLELIMYEPRLWMNFARWGLEKQFSASRLPYFQNKKTVFLLYTHEQVVIKLQSLSHCACAGHMSIDVVKKLIALDQSVTRPAWLALGSRWAEAQYVSSLENELTEMLLLMSNLESTLSTLLPTGWELETVLDAKGKWNVLLLNVARQLLGRHLPEGHAEPHKVFLQRYALKQGGGSEYLNKVLMKQYPQLSSHILASVDWLSLVLNKKLTFFERFWFYRCSYVAPTAGDEETWDNGSNNLNKAQAKEQREGGGGYVLSAESIPVVVNEWVAMLENLENCSVNFELLDLFGDTLISSRKDLITFVRCCSGIKLMKDTVRGAGSIATAHAMTTVVTDLGSLSLSESDSALPQPLPLLPPPPPPPPLARFMSRSFSDGDDVTRSNYNAASTSTSITATVPVNTTTAAVKAQQEDVVYVALSEQHPLVEERCTTIIESLDKWKHIANLNYQREHVQQVMTIARDHFLDVKGAEEMTLLIGVFTDLCALIDSSGDWKNQSLFLVHNKYWALASQLHHGLALCSSELLTAISECRNLLRWLRQQRDDGTFSSSIEMALGASEIETPVALWDSKHGRVNEQLFSMLRNIRSYLHPFLYKWEEEVVGSVLEFVSVFSDLNAAVDPSVVAGNLPICDKLHEAFVQIVCDDADSVVQGRLVQLYSAKAESEWRLSSPSLQQLQQQQQHLGMETARHRTTTPLSKREGAVAAAVDAAGGAGAVDVDIDNDKKKRGKHKSKVAVRMDGGGGGGGGGHSAVRDLVSLYFKEASGDKYLSHDSPELLDFQSNVVLANTTEKDGGIIQGVIDRFLFQFSWMRRMAVAMSSLHQAGHFGYYPDYSFVISTAEDGEIFKSLVLDRERELEEWERGVRTIRKSHYFLNFYDIKRSFTLIEVLEERSNNSNVNRNSSSSRTSYAAKKRSAKEQDDDNDDDDDDKDEKEKEERYIDEKLSVVLAEYVCNVNVVAASSRVVLKQVGKELLHAWLHAAEMSTASPAEHAAGNTVHSLTRLRNLATSLDTAFKIIKPRCRPIDCIPDIEDYISIGRIHTASSDSGSSSSSSSSSINVALASTRAEEINVALALYAHMKVLPEWENCLLCSADTTEEQVVSFLLRWHRSSTHAAAAAVVVAAAAVPTGHDGDDDGGGGDGDDGDGTTAAMESKASDNLPPPPFCVASGTGKSNSSNMNSRSNVLYTLIGVSQLAYTVQSELIALTKELATIAADNRMAPPPPLFLISHEGQQSLILTQFSHKKVFVSPIPRKLLTRIGLCLCGSSSSSSSIYNSASARSTTAAATSGAATTSSGLCVNNDSLGVHTYRSPVAGAGKTFAIRSAAHATGRRYVHVAINNSFTPVHILVNRIISAMSDEHGTTTAVAAVAAAATSHEEEQEQQEFTTAGSNKNGVLLHLDLASSVSSGCIRNIFELCVLGVLQDHLDFSQRVFWIPSPLSVAIMIEVPNGLTDKMLQRHCELYPYKFIVPSSEAFCKDRDALSNGMAEDFDSSLFDGFAKDSSSSAGERSDAFVRLKYVSSALYTLQERLGQFPYQFDDAYIELQWSKDKCQADCFSLIAEACKMSATGSVPPSLGCMWTFINVFYWQLREMHHPESPLNGCCMIDTTREDISIEDETFVKERIKAEIVTFIARTACEFSVRQMKEAENANYGRAVSVRLTGWSRGSFCQTWDRCPYDNDGRPCFQSNCRKFFLYFRKKDKQWVIDDAITATGAYYSCSADERLHSKWSTSQSWEDTRLITSTAVKDVGGYKGEAIKIVGCDKVTSGSYCDHNDNGVYLRQPPFDDINGYPHYIKHQGETRRHLFYSKESRQWQVSPVCNDDHGCYILSKQTSPVSKGWMYLPPDKIEAGHSFMFTHFGMPGTCKSLERNSASGGDFIGEDGTVLEGGATEGGTGTVSLGGGSRGAVGTELGPHDGNDEDDNEQRALGGEDLSSSSLGFDESLIKWRHSNHECVLFSNATHTVSFLSFNPKTMKDKMHPLLLDHLQQNQINVGESLEDLSSSHWKLLSSLTGVHRTAQEANSILGGNFCLTGDSLMKMLAIFYRVRCGVPVVLLGECGCGKTFLLSYLCAWLGVTLLSLDVHGGTTEEEILDVFIKAGTVLEESAAVKSQEEDEEKNKKSKRSKNQTKNYFESTVFVFLDEVNTCAHMGLINEAICHRSINGQRIHEGIQILAALNPYRLKSEEATAAAAAVAGLTMPGVAGGLLDEQQQQQQRQEQQQPQPLELTSTTNSTAAHALALATTAPRVANSSGFSSSSSSSENDLADPLMSLLVYKVHRIPATMQNFIFDFGALESGTELLYITSMVKGFTYRTDDGPTKLNEDEIAVISTLILRSQDYIRKIEGDPSVVSLRDVKRVLVLMRWFLNKILRGGGGGSGGASRGAGAAEAEAAASGAAGYISRLGRAATLSLAHVYCYRLPTAFQRNSYWSRLSSIIKAEGKVAKRIGFESLGKHGFPSALVWKMQAKFVRHLEIEPGIALNQALSENLFVIIICILNKIPIFVVGKPGTSKTLAIQIIASNLQGLQSPKPFWRPFPSVYIFQYQCSPLSTAASIQFQFEAAKSYQEHSQDILTVLLLDEVGLAENSPDMPLKVLHYMLVDPPIAIVGISNWTLDSSKMNRAVCLQRPEPSVDDFMMTSKEIVDGDLSLATLHSSSDGGAGASAGVVKSNGGSGSGNDDGGWLANLAKTFHELYRNQRSILNCSRDLIGMRDYYAILKFLRSKSESIPDSKSTTTAARSTSQLEILCEAVSRNLSAKPDALKAILTMFVRNCLPHIENEFQRRYGTGGATGATGAAAATATAESSVYRKDSEIDPRIRIPRMRLILDNLYANSGAAEASSSSSSSGSSTRHLMVLSGGSNGASALHLLFGRGAISEDACDVLVGSRFKDDLHELHLIQQINRVKQAMSSGRTVVLLNHDSIYESLYDVLNQRYVTRADPDTGRVRRMLRLALGPRSQLCAVEQGFRLVVVVPQLQAYDRLDLPLLNRFEKQVLTPDDLISGQASVVLQELQYWVQCVVDATGLNGPADMFCGYFAGTLPSLVLRLTNYGRTKKDNGTDTDSRQEISQLLKQAKLWLLGMAMPAAVLLVQSAAVESLEASETWSSDTVQVQETIAGANADTDRGVAMASTTTEQQQQHKKKKNASLAIFEDWMSVPYFDQHADLFSLLETIMNTDSTNISETTSLSGADAASVMRSCEGSTSTSGDKTGELLLVTTKSPITHFYSSLESWRALCTTSSTTTASSSSSSSSSTNRSILNTLDVYKDVTVIALATVPSEKQLMKMIKEFYDYSAIAATAAAVSSSSSSGSSSKGSAMKVLFVISDPLVCDPELIAYARLICSSMHKQYHQSLTGSASAAVRAAAGQRHVVFVVCLPPSVPQHERQFLLDFHAPWSYAFVDDLRPASIVEAPGAGTDSGTGTGSFVDSGHATKKGASLQLLFSQPIFQLLNDDVLNLQELIKTNLPSALARCMAPRLAISNSICSSNIACTTEKALYDLLAATDRNHNVHTSIRSMKYLLSYPSFSSYVCQLVMHCLNQPHYREKSRATCGMLTHVYNSCMDTAASAVGNFREALLYSIENAVTQTLSHVLRQLDRNFHLSWLYRACQHVAAVDTADGAADKASASTGTVSSAAVEAAKIESIISSWIQVVDKFLPADNISSTCVIVKPSELNTSALVDRNVHNTGLHGPLVCCLPMSDKIVSLLGAPGSGAAATTTTTDTRRSVEALAGGDINKTMRSLASYIGGTLGQSVCDFLSAQLAVNEWQYLHDFVACCVTAAPRVSFEEHLVLTGSIMELYGGCGYLDIGKSTGGVKTAAAAAVCGGGVNSTGTESDTTVGPTSTSTSTFTSTIRGRFSPAVVHALYWSLELRLHHVFSIISTIRTVCLSSSAMGTGVPSFFGVDGVPTQPVHACAYWEQLVSQKDRNALAVVYNLYLKGVRRKVQGFVHEILVPAMYKLRQKLTTSSSSSSSSSSSISDSCSGSDSDSLIQQRTIFAQGDCVVLEVVTKFLTDTLQDALEAESLIVDHPPLVKATSPTMAATTPVARKGTAVELNKKEEKGRGGEEEEEEEAANMLSDAAVDILTAATLQQWHAMSSAVLTELGALVELSLDSVVTLYQHRREVPKTAANRTEAASATTAGAREAEVQEGVGDSLAVVAVEVLESVRQSVYRMYGIQLGLLAISESQHWMKAFRLHTYTGTASSDSGSSSSSSIDAQHSSISDSSGTIIATPGAGDGDGDGGGVTSSSSSSLCTFLSLNALSLNPWDAHCVRRVLSDLQGCGGPAWCSLAQAFITRIMMPAHATTTAATAAAATASSSSSSSSASTSSIKSFILSNYNANDGGGESGIVGVAKVFAAILSCSSSRWRPDGHILMDWEEMMRSFMRPPTGFKGAATTTKNSSSSSSSSVVKRDVTFFELRKLPRPSHHLSLRKVALQFLCSITIPAVAPSVTASTTISTTTTSYSRLETELQNDVLYSCFREQSCYGLEALQLYLERMELLVRKTLVENNSDGLNRLISGAEVASFVKLLSKVVNQEQWRDLLLRESPTRLLLSLAVVRCLIQVLVQQYIMPYLTAIAGTGQHRQLKQSLQAALEGSYMLCGATPAATPEAAAEAAAEEAAAAAAEPQLHLVPLPSCSTAASAVFCIPYLNANLLQILPDARLHILQCVWKLGGKQALLSYVSADPTVSLLPMAQGVNCISEELKSRLKSFDPFLLCFPAASIADIEMNKKKQQEEEEEDEEKTRKSQRLRSTSGRSAAISNNNNSYSRTSSCNGAVASVAVYHSACAVLEDLSQPDNQYGNLAPLNKWFSLNTTPPPPAAASTTNRSSIYASSSTSSDQTTAALLQRDCCLALIIAAASDLMGGVSSLCLEQNSSSLVRWLKERVELCTCITPPVRLALKAIAETLLVTSRHGRLALILPPHAHMICGDSTTASASASVCEPASSSSSSSAAAASSSSSSSSVSSYAAVSPSVRSMWSQLSWHTVIIALQNPGSYLAALLCDPASLKSQLLPTMAMDEFSAISASVGYVGWYKCPNGHPYAVGNCTWPMETARCPVEGCGALIGGQNHSAVKGVTRMGTGEEAGKENCPKGYLLENTGNYDNGDSASGCTKITVQVLRLFMHLLLRFSMDLEALPSSCLGAAQLLYPLARIAPQAQAREKLLNRVAQDWDALKASTALNESDLATALHLCLSKLSESALSNSTSTESYIGILPAADRSRIPSSKMTFDSRVQFMHYMNNAIVNKVFTQSARASMEALRDSLSSDSEVLALRECLGVQSPYILQTGLCALLSTVTPPLPAAAAANTEINSKRHEKNEEKSQIEFAMVRSALWRTYDAPTYDSFLRSFALNAKNSMSYPLLAAVLRNEEQLPYIKYIKDILSWHAVLYSVLKPGSISRDQASSLTNKDIINMLPAGTAQAEASVVLQNYCIAFNTSLRLVPFLYECSPNPFLTASGDVDLSGGRGKGSSSIGMSENTTINFSIPSSSNGETEAAGLCTIKLVHSLTEIHNRLFVALQEAAGTEEDDKTTNTTTNSGSGSNRKIRSTAKYWRRFDDHYPLEARSMSVPYDSIKHHIGLKFPLKTAGAAEAAATGTGTDKYLSDHSAKKHIKSSTGTGSSNESDILITGPPLAYSVSPVISMLDVLENARLSAHADEERMEEENERAEHSVYQRRVTRREVHRTARAPAVVAAEEQAAAAAAAAAAAQQQRGGGGGGLVPNNAVDSAAEQAGTNNDAQPRPVTAAAAPVPAGNNNNHNMMGIPITTYMTPVNMLRRRLIYYEREKQLIPSIEAFALQRLDYKHTELLGFDFGRIEGDLKRMLLATAGPLVVHTRQFQYSGELQQGGGLRHLGSILTQSRMPLSVLEQVFKDVDTKHRMVRLKAQVEECVLHLLATATGGEDLPEMLLERYVLDTLLVDTRRWSEMGGGTTGSALSTQVKMKHLQSLYLGLEERLMGDPLQDVALAYKEPLTEPLRDGVLLASAAAGSSVDELVSALRAFATEQLSSGGTWPAEASLKEYLCYSAPDLEDLDWYADTVPDDLQLRHTYHVYHLLKTK